MIERHPFTGESSQFISKSEVKLLSCVDSLQRHGLQPTRLLCPWNFPGKNTEVGCHFLLQGIFPTQGQNPGLLHCRQMLLPSEPPGKYGRITTNKGLILGSQHTPNTKHERKTLEKANQNFQFFSIQISFITIKVCSQIHSKTP